MNDCVRLSGIDIYAHHGALPAERELGQRFVVDVALWVDLERASATDALAATIDYSAVHRVVIETATSASFHLIEALAGRLCRVLLTDFEAERVSVCVRKSQPPIPGFWGTASVTIERDKGWLEGGVGTTP